ncbi:MAG TPA: hypothetical protein DCX32_00840 [Candidatus Moranbacteria bacterium]|nr:MAG: hypothetical protein UW87_C0010G0006 [Candidatus Moranbacteria bacterium GW2011_GWC2_45_10]KKT94705.1 MAG: hypothetical protein UW95_C0010G0012 [Parcubacteria group bacterium GW2011_GWC1_45_14]HAV11084.1 hypothetical protein [Candidatus Moranbacteria bacterium]
MSEIIDDYFYPMLAPEVDGKIDTDEAILERWDKYDLLSEDNKAVLISDQTAIKLQALNIKFSFSKKVSAEISGIVRGIFFGEVNIENLPQEIKRRTFVDEIESIAIKSIIENIIYSRSEIVKKKKEEKINLPLDLALKKFPKLGEQLITSAPLKLRVFPEMVKPSVKNWIADYHDALGREKHGTIERGNYLFHGENTKRLTSLERRRLAEVLKSLDDGSEIPIDSQSQKIVFESKAQEYDTAPVQRQVPTPSLQPQKGYTTPKPSALKREPARSEIPAKSSSEGDRKVENYFGAAAAGKSAYDFKVPAKSGSVSARPASPSFPKPVNVERPAEKNIVAGNVQEHYEIPTAQSPKPAIRNREPEIYNLKSVSQNLEPKTWNPAESVRKRMAEESASFGPSQIAQQKRETIEKPQGNLRFSSPQTLPVEKKQEALKTVSPNTYALPPKPAPAVAKPNPSVQPTFSKPSFSEQAPVEEDLMAKMRALKNQQGQKANPRAVYKITPMGFVKKTDEELLAEKDGKGPKVNGNVVDLR